ncbi:MAG: protein translocase subunit SecF [Calditrichaeota bacterium]|nr:protein translocase subunit SecF [Calditrichota bacterium]
MQIFKNANFQFISKRKTGYIVSSILIIASIISLIIHGGPKYNIDFTGGSLVHLKFEKPVAIEDVRALLSKSGFTDAEIKHFGSPTEVSIRIGVSQTRDSLSYLIESGIHQAMPDNPFEERRNEIVGPKIGKELIVDALLAIFWSMILILIYVMWRFEFKFSVGAIAALLHDIIITLGIFSIFDIEISSPIIAAVLTIVGYSLNDTIVVFDRIRENLKAASKNISDISGIVNNSINQTLSRTIITSGTTLMVVIVLFFFGGKVLKTFALALIIGIGIGTYSSIFVASPIVIDWRTKKA